MKSRAAQWFGDLEPAQRTVGAARFSIRMARTELAYLLMRAGKLKDAYLLTHGITRASFIAEARLAQAELIAADKGLAALPSYAPAASLPPFLRRAVMLETDAAHRRAVTDASKMVITPLIQWPGTLLGMLGQEEAERASQTWSRAASDIVKEASELATPSTWDTSTLIIAASVGGLTLLAGMFALVMLSARPR